MTCSREWQAQAIDDGRLGEADVAAFERHAPTCVDCRGAQARLAELHALAEQLPVPVPSELQMRRLRARLLHDAMSVTTRIPRRVPLLVAVAAAALVLVGAAVLRRHPSEAFAGTVHSEAAAAWTQERNARIEHVVLNDGDISLSVRKQEADERFLVVVPDGEVEVRGTTFEVAVHDRHTTRVHVDDGVVVVRVNGSTTLVAGESWPTKSDAVAASTMQPPTELPSVEGTRPAAAVGAEPAVSGRESQTATPARPSLAARPDAASSAPSVAATVVARAGDSEGLHDYEHAIEVYRSGQFEQAAELFRTFSAAHPTSSLLDDASFLEASSLSSAGRGDAAALLAERHLARFPQSFHRKEAAILVARLRRDRGDCEGARSVAATWLAESLEDPRVRAALGGCAGH